jgi:acetylornithine deacetylase/succinyl-diaminopimelate desuccinylase family protein
MVRASEISAAARDAAAAVDADEVIALARALIRSPSENPGGTEDGPAGIVAEVLAALGAAPETVRSPGGRPSVLGELGRGERSLVFNGHLDVVPAGEADAWPHPPYEAAIADGLLWGRGSADMKGPVAAALGAAAAIRRAGIEPAGRLVFHLVADEEYMGTHGTAVLLREGYLHGDACVVGEPSELSIGLAQRGGAWIRATSHGTIAHGSTPHLGVNAIESMARFVLASPDALPDRTHPLTGAPTINVSTIEGGRSFNVVPDRCEVEVDRRAVPGETLDDVVAGIDRVLQTLANRHPGFDVSIDVKDWCEPAETADDAPIVTALRAAAGDVLGQPPDETGFTGITDARFYTNDAGVPAVLYGPGSLTVAHTANEHIALDELVDGARVYAQTFVRFLTG